MDTEKIGLTPKLAVDFVVIVAGVFVALAAESWWSEREDRQYEREIREDMIIEFQGNLRILDADIAINEEVKKGIEVLANVSDDALFSLADTALSQQLNPYLNWAGFDPEMGSVQAFVESGNVGAIGNRALRLLLARWAGLLEMRRRYNLQAVDFQHREIIPVLARASADGKWSKTERREMRTLLATFVSLHGIVLNNQYELREAATDILEFLDDSQ
jgi:hypothetical protein